jgi:Nucleotidyltransferase domain
MAKGPAKLEPMTAAKAAVKRNFSEAKIVFLAGSSIRADATETSDLDLVVIFDHLDHAYRMSFTHGGWPVEAFVHDPQTLAYFLEEIDSKNGFPALPAMVVESSEVTEPSALSREIRSQAQAVLDRGPPDLTVEEIENRRYMITDVIEDLRDPATLEELVSAGARFYPALADFYCRVRGEWSAQGKQIPRNLRRIDPIFAERYAQVFDALFVDRDAKGIIRLSEELLEPVGGTLFDGFRRDAPADWRR